jgi:DMSO/TMAO reductase YedYZ molybdopterin-dependent catalytic subunit
MDKDFDSNPAGWNRRRFIQAAGLAGLAGALGAGKAAAEDTVTLPFENGERPLAVYPQKRPLIRLTARPPQLETPFSVFNEGILTPNDAFFVRYHLAAVPTSIDPDKFRLEVKGKVNTEAEFSMADLKSKFEMVEVVAVNQCSGNSRGFFQPRVPGGQLANGAMGNAKWKGVRLADVLKKCGVAAGAKQMVYRGLDKPVMENVTPAFVKALNMDQALDGEILLAFEMNGEALPWLNGFPLRLVVPGYYGTYLMKHISSIRIIDREFPGFWMNPAYRIPDNDCACVEPGTTPAKTVPIGRFNVRSFITSLADKAKIKSGEDLTVRGIAFDGGHGIKEVMFSEDDGVSWRGAALGKDLGNYSFREWTIPFTAKKAGEFKLRVKATNRIGQTQPMEPLWNPAGYMRNVVETVKVTAA